MITGRRCYFNRRNLSRKKKDKNKIVGISIFSKDYKVVGNQRGYIGSINVSANFVDIYTNGHYQYIPIDKAIKLFKEIIKRYEEK